MAKRFTANDKWEDLWFRKLNLKSKLFWLFILDKCNIAGIWKIDYEAASFYIGEKITADIQKDFEGRIEVLDTDKLWIIKFIEFQYSNLNGKSNLFNSVKKELERFNLYGRVQEGFRNPPRKGKGKGTGTGKGKGSGKVVDFKRGSRGVAKPLEVVSGNFGNLNPKQNLQLQTEFNHFKDMRKKMKRPLTEYAEELAIKKLYNLSGGNFHNAIKILQKSIEASWQGLFALPESEVEETYIDPRSEEEKTADAEFEKLSQEQQERKKRESAALFEKIIREGLEGKGLKNANAMRTQCERNAIKLNEIKLNEIKVNEIKVNKRKETAEVKTSATFFQQVLPYFIKKFQEKYNNQKPAINFGKDNIVVSKTKGLFAKDEDWQKLIYWFLESEKAKEFGCSLSICFSTHTINLFKTSKNKYAGLDDSNSFENSGGQDAK